MATNHEHDHEHADGCLCGADHGDKLATPDDELPPATGGVQVPRRLRRPIRDRVSAGEKDHNG